MSYIETRINFKNNDSAIKFAESTPESVVLAYTLAPCSQLVIFSKPDARFGKKAMDGMVERVFSMIEDFEGELIEEFPIDRKPTYFRI